MQWNAKQWRRSIQRFKAFMVPLVAFLGRREQRAAATSYVQGLLMPGQRKSIEPMAERLGGALPTAPAVCGRQPLG
jgi:SRSO17 transposase